MSDTREKLDAIIKEAERAAYARGWQDAFSAITEASQRLRRHEPDMDNPHMVPGVVVHANVMKARRGRPPSNAMQVISDCIAATPGMRGVDVVHAAQSVDSSIKERTVRTCLRRLRLKKVIWKRNERWFPKPKEKLQNGLGEAVGSPPP